jgi:hypothetical protein
MQVGGDIALPPEALQERPLQDAANRYPSSERLLYWSTEMRATAAPSLNDPDSAMPRLGPLEDLSLDERRRLAAATASTINHTLARLFLRLGPPPAGTSEEFNPVTSGGGGAQQ